MSSSSLPEAEQRIARELVDQCQVESLLNREGDQLPFGFFNPASEGKVTWNCGKDPEGRITSVFGYNVSSAAGDRRVQYITMEQALDIRQQLIEAGWQKIVPPEVTFRYPGLGDRPLTRKEKKLIQRRVQRINRRRNPFLGASATAASTAPSTVPSAAPSTVSSLPSRDGGRGEPERAEGEEKADGQ